MGVALQEDAVRKFRSRLRDLGVLRPTDGERITVQQYVVHS